MISSVEEAIAAVAALPTSALILIAALGAAAFQIGRWVMGREQRGALSAARRAVEAALAGRRAALGDRDDALAAKAVAERMSAASAVELADYAARVSDAMRGAAIMRPVDPAARAELTPSRIPIIAVGNLKGGVGKTTLAANLGAYLADPRREATAARGAIGGPRAAVLFIDLDFQGSLSSALLAQSRAEPANRTAALFQSMALDRHAPGVAETGAPARAAARAAPLGGPLAGSGSAFFDCGYAAAALEDRLLFEWAVEQSGLDMRLTLARFLRSESVQSRYGAVVLDLPPRNTAFAINALAAATDLVIPTRADALSTEGVSVFAAQLAALRGAIWPRLNLVGLVGAMTRAEAPRGAEARVLADAAEDAERLWGAPTPLLGAIPTRTAIAADAGRGFAYFNHRDGEVGGAPHDILLRVARAVEGRLSRPPTRGGPAPGL